MQARARVQAQVQAQAVQIQARIRPQGRMVQGSQPRHYPRMLPPEPEPWLELELELLALVSLGRMKGTTRAGHFGHFEPGGRLRNRAGLGKLDWCYRAQIGGGRAGPAAAESRRQPGPPRPCSRPLPLPRPRLGPGVPPFLARIVRAGSIDLDRAGAGTGEGSRRPRRRLGPR